MSGAPVDAVRELERALLDPGASTLPRAILRLRAEGDEAEAARRRLKGLVTRVTALRRFSQEGEFRFKDVDALYAEALRAGAPGYVLEVLNYLRLYQVVASRMRDLRLGDERWFAAEAPRREADEIVATVESLDNLSPDLLSTRLVLGKLYAMRSRADAARVFSDARDQLDACSDVFGHDCGANTYFDREGLDGDATAIAERTAALPARREHRSAKIEQTRFLILMSCERKFLRIYLPYWLTVGEYLKPQGFAFHIMIIDGTGDAAELVGDAEALLWALAKFRGYDSRTFCDHFSFSSVQMPDWCVEEKTFSATSRYLYARALCEEVGMRVIVQDIDLCISHDPAPWYRAMPDDKILLGSYSPDLSIDPWRKFSAGVFGLPPDTRALSLMREVERYLVKGLVEQSNWYLDQNALSFLHDCMTGEGQLTDSLLFSLDEQREGMAPVPGGLRPIHLLPVHSLFEKAQL